VADEVRQPRQVIHDYGLYKLLPGNEGIVPDDIFFGPKDRVYADFVARDTVRLRGTSMWYYVLEDTTRRIDGVSPLSNQPVIPLTLIDDGVDPAFKRRRHAGLALYGEHVKIGKQLDSVTSEVQPDWPYMDPILVKGFVYEVENEEEPDERGSIWIRRCTIDFARIHCETEWMFQPYPNDVVRLPRMFDQYFDIERVERNESRFGQTGFFTIFKCMCIRSSKYDPRRKIATRKKTDGEEPPGDPHL
jgi:hypothetical protein